MAATEREREISFNICQKIGVSASYKKKKKKEANLVEWNGGPAKIDIRDWDPSHEHMGKGITLYPEEADRLQWLLFRYFKGKGGKKREQAAQSPAEENAAENPAEEKLQQQAILQDGAETGDVLAQPVQEEVEEALQLPEESF